MLKHAVSTHVWMDSLNKSDRQSDHWSLCSVTVTRYYSFYYMALTFYFVWADEDDGMERVCDTLFMCIITVLNQGLRNGGGVGDILRRPSKTVRMSVSATASRKWSHFKLLRSSLARDCTTQEPLFAARVVYDLLFFFVVIIIVLNLIFGVIIDTFADLRSEKQRKEEILKTTCFICGACKSQDTQRFMMLTCANSD